MDCQLSEGNKSVSGLTILGITSLLMSFSQTLVHQIGHSLGLSHSNVYDSIMFPFIKTFNASSPVTFHREDVKAIQTLYGEKTGTTDLSSAQLAAGEEQWSFLSSNTFLAETRRERNLCSDSSVDTIFRTVDGNTYVFQGDKVIKMFVTSSYLSLQYWRLTNQGIAEGEGYPKK